MRRGLCIPSTASPVSAPEFECRKRGADGASKTAMIDGAKQKIDKNEK